jgi:hypothetical protein
MPPGETPYAPALSHLDHRNQDRDVEGRLLFAEMLLASNVVGET